jgi:hypothetical protein
MKKISVFLAVLFLGVSSVKAQPQLEKGKLLLGVTSTVALNGSMSSEFLSLSFITIKYKYGSDPAEDWYKMNSFNILPKAGYFVAEDLVAGLQMVASGYTETDLEDDDTYKENTLGIGPFVRFYYPLDKFYPFIEAESIFGTIRETYYSDDEKSPFLMLGVSIGASLPLGDKVTFDAAAGYLRSSVKNTDAETEDTVHYITSGFGLRLGFNIYLQMPGL